MTPPYTVTVQTPPRLARRRRAVRAWAAGVATVPLSAFRPASNAASALREGAMSAPAFALRGGGAANPFLGAAVEAGHDVCAGPSSPLPVEALPAPDVAADLDR